MLSTSISTMSTGTTLKSASLDEAKSYLQSQTDVKVPYIGLVRSYSERFGIDYRLVLALIKQESRFREGDVSTRGASGLMQIMPLTSSEINERLDLGSIELPEENLHAGIYYFSSLLRLFESSAYRDRICLSLAAYNAGPSRIYDAQELAAYIGEDPNTWQGIKNTLPLLSKRYYTLHQSVWPDGRPKNGYFGGWKQTLVYVGNVIENYDNYQRMFR